MLRSAVSLVAAALVLGGCTKLGPDFVRPEAPVADDWIEFEDPKVEEKPDEKIFREWWTVFGDPVLNELVQAAYRQNLDLQIAGIRILESRAQLGIAVGSLYPQSQTVGADATANQTSENAPGSLGKDFFYDYGVGFDAAWELDFWGRFRRGVEAADSELFASIADYDNLLVSLTSEVARVYVVIRTFEERIQIARQNIKIQERSLRIANVRFQNGIVTELDVTQALSLLRNTQASIPRLQTGLRQAQNALSTLLGMPPSNLKEMLGGPGAIPKPPVDVAVGIPAELLRRRPDIRRAELQAASQSARIGIAETDLYPKFTLFGSIGLQSSDKSATGGTFSDLFDSDSLTYSFGPGVQWAIFNYGRLKNNVRVQDARFQGLIVNYQNTVLRAAQEVEDGLVGFLRSQEEVKLRADSVAATQRSVDLSLIQYRDGVVDYQRVLDSQERLVGEQDLLTNNRGDVSLNLIATYKALGGGWQIREGKDFVPAQTREEMAKRTDWGKLLKPAALDVPTPEEASDELFPRPDW
jgi:NodT family efflux transporter outer membrane factor (OMF) lipoprotein